MAPGPFPIWGNRRAGLVARRRGVAKLYPMTSSEFAAACNTKQYAKDAFGRTVFVTALTVDSVPQAIASGLPKTTPAPWCDDPDCRCYHPAGYGNC